LQRTGRALLLPDERRDPSGRRVAQARKGSFAVILDTPLLDFSPGIVQREEHMFVEALLVQAAVERFDDCILVRLSAR
jgi:hypothetical protein